MSLSVPRLPLVVALKALSGTIFRRTAHLAVGQVAIEVEPRPDSRNPPSLLLAMTDFQVTAWMREPLPEDPDALSAIVDADRLLRFLSHDPADQVTLALEGGRGDLVVTGRSTAKLATLPPNSYAQHPLPPAEGWEALPFEALCDAFARVSWASGTGKHGSPSTLCLRASAGLLDAFAMRDGRVMAGQLGFCAALGDSWPRQGLSGLVEDAFDSSGGTTQVLISPAVASFLAARKLDPGASVEVAVESGRRIWWRGDGFQVAEQWSEEKHPDYGKVFEEVGRPAPLVATLTPDQAEELASGLYTLSGLGSWGLGSEEKRTDVLTLAVHPQIGFSAYLRSDTSYGEFVLGDVDLHSEAKWHTSFPGELVKALAMLSGGGDIEVRCREGMHLFLFNERGGCASLSGRIP